MVRAIERDPSEVAVAPLRQRALARFAHRKPPSSRPRRRRDREKVADEIAAGQADKR